MLSIKILITAIQLFASVYNVDITGSNPLIGQFSSALTLATCNHAPKPKVMSISCVVAAFELCHYVDESDTFEDTGINIDCTKILKETYRSYPGNLQDYK